MRVQLLGGHMPQNPFGFNVKPINVWGTSEPKRKRQLTSAQKIWCWEHNPHTCNVCSKRVTKFSDAEFDHTRAHSKGGASNLNNIKITCRQCNRLKGTKSLSETKRLLGIKSKSKKKRRTRKKNSSTGDIFGIGSIPRPKFRL